MGDSFNAGCQTGEVIVMETAKYGRMESSSCIMDDGETGCSNDILNILDPVCSGKIKCDFVPVLELPKVKKIWCGGMVSYFRASYSCTRG